MKGHIASLVLLTALAAGCRRSGAPPLDATAPEPWAVTAWGELYEVFPETDPLVAGRVAPSHTHVTILSGFAPLREGKVEIILRGASGEERFAGTFRRDGIFEVPVRPRAKGEFDLVFRVESAQGSEEIPGGRVRVGDAEDPGGLVSGPPPPHGVSGGAAAGDSVSFLKEQQWKTPFATAWTSDSSLQLTLAGTARVRAAAGGEVLLSAPVDALLAARPWPHLGRALRRGAAIFRYLPSVDASRSLAELGADVASLEAEVRGARDREGRLGRLLDEGAASRAEVERARANREALEARLGAARRDHQAATAARSGRPTGRLQSLGAPFDGVVAEVAVSPGQAVAAGTMLGRFVRTRPVWLEVALRPEDAARAGALQRVVLRRAADAEPVVVTGTGVRLVSRSPEVDRQTGTVAVTLEVQLGADDLPIGSALQADLVVPGAGTAVVVPDSALVDDGGVTVVYVQVEGEAFARRPVRVLGRQGEARAVSGLAAGERLVVRGGAEIRRASLLSAGAPEGHVH